MPLFVFPLIVAAVGVSIVGLFFYLTSEHRTFDDFVRDLRSRSETERFQAAYDLAARLNAVGPEFVGPGGAAKLALIFEEATGDEPLRQFLAAALGRIGDPAAAPALVAALDDPSPIVRDAAARALAEIKPPAASAALRGRLADDSPEVRASAAAALAAIGDPESVGALRQNLGDADPFVRLNVAAALAHRSDAAGIPTLLSGLDRGRIAAEFNIASMEDQERVILFAIRSIDGLPSDEAAALIVRLSTDDPSLRVREASLKFLDDRKTRVPAPKPGP